MSIQEVADRAAVDPALAKELRGRLRGRLLDASDADYDEARSVYNRMIDKRPSLIARCTGVADVLACVEWARRHDVLVAVRGGGHSVAGRSVCDGGLVIDLSPMNGVRVDPVARTAQADGGALWGDFDHATSAFGLATTGGVVSTTGVGGLTLGGGIGWLQGKYGLSCDNLLSVDVVTADGRFVTASESENDDLFWGVRGGGGNFGIVTSFEFRLHPIEERILAGALLYPGELGGELLRWYGEWSAIEPDDITTFMVFLHAPAWPMLPERLHGKPMIGLALAHAGPLADAEKAIRPIREAAEPALDLVAPTPYTTLQRMSDNDWRFGLLNYWKPEFLEPMTGALADTIVEHTERFVPPVFDDPASDVIAAQPINCFEIGHMGGATRHVGEDDTAYSRRDAEYLVNVTAVWTRPEETDRLVQWTRDFSQALQPFSAGGGYVNYFVGDDGEERVKATYGAEKYARLAALKAKYDPTNFFRLNPNVKPAL